MNLSFFRNKKVTVMGLGLHGGGVGTAKFFAELGARVLVTDLKSREELAFSINQLKGFNIEYVLGGHRLKDFKNTDLIIKGPSVRSDSMYFKEAIRNKVPVGTDVGIFFKFCKAPIIAVTGTKGKSTVATLISTFLEEEYSDVVLAGNIRTSVLSKLKQIKKDTKVVLELSSWQLAGVKALAISPHFALITNIMADHMNYYESMDEYIADKSIIFKHQKPSDFLVLNYDNKITRSFAKQAKSKVYFYSLKKMSDFPSHAKIGSFVDKKVILSGEEEKSIANIAEIKMLGRHNIENLLAAITVATLYRVPAAKIKKVIAYQMLLLRPLIHLTSPLF